MNARIRDPRAARPFTSIAFACTATLALAACGGGGGGSGSAAVPPPETLFTSQNQWIGPVPADATNVAPEEFRRMHTAGEIGIVTSLEQPELERARRERIERDLVFLESQPDLTQDEQALIARARATSNYLDAPLVTLPDGQRVALLDVGSRIEALAKNYRDARDPLAVTAAYALSHALLGEDLQAQLPSPVSLAGAPLDQIEAARRQLDTLLETVPDLDRVRLDLDAAPASAAAGSMKIDNNGVCAPTGLARSHWFPLRSFVSPMKQQGMRAVCWAFSAVAAIESRERVQNDVAVDLSEQFFINQAKHQWLPSEFVDTGSARDALNAAADRNDPLQPENEWPYNPSYGRPDTAFDAGVVGTAASYVNACADYAPASTCSQSAHQSHRYCTTQNGRPFCGYSFMTYTGAGVRASRARLLWKSGQPFDLNSYRALLASGVSIIGVFPIYDGFRNVAADGRLTDYAKVNDGGGHLAQIVGFIGNEAMTFGPLVSNVGGGGYFVLRNSWGCTAADAGYYYIPADYVISHFSALEALEFDARRSQRWLDDQAIPGGTSGLSIDPRGVTTVDARVPTNLATTFGVRQPGATYVRLRVSSDRDGLLYDGQWVVENPAAPGGILFGTDLWTTFQTSGQRTLTLTARYGTQSVTTTKTVIATNTAPQIAFETIDQPQEGEPFVVTALVTDINEPSSAAMCDAMTWQVQDPDAIVSGSGCSRTIRFGIAGARTVRASTQDREGSTASRIQTFAVAPPPANPYPRVTSARLYSRDFHSNPLIGCQANAVASGAIVDLRRRGCSPLIAEQIARFAGQVEVENPLQEALSYQWTLSVRYPSDTAPRRILNTTTAAPLYPVEPLVFGGLDAPNPCTIDVTVVAPEPARNKRVRVWTGQCIHIEDAPR